MGRNLTSKSPKKWETLFNSILTFDLISKHKLQLQIKPFFVVTLEKQSDADINSKNWVKALLYFMI